MYIGFTDQRGAEHSILEFVANAIDLFLTGQCTKVQVRVEGDQITVMDDGLGYPFGKPTALAGISEGEFRLTQPHCTATADGHAPHIHLASTGLGIAVVNALSSELLVDTVDRTGCRWRQSFAEGVPLAPPEKSTTSSPPGTRFSYRLDPGIFSKCYPRNGSLRQILFQAAHLFPGIRIDLNEERFHAPEGLSQLAFLYEKNVPDIMQKEPFSFNMRCGDISIHATAYGKRERRDKTPPTVRSWINGVTTREHGSHVKGFQDALRRVKWPVAVLLIHVVMWDPRFAGPTRDKLISPEIRKNVREALAEPLRLWCS